jgi:hypothetical protein
MNNGRLKPVHAIIGNAPAGMSVLCDDAIAIQRTFMGAGPPSASTLLAGNGKYCATKSGWVVAASLLNGGINYTVGYVFNLFGGTGTPTQITVDAINAATGAIFDFHVSQAGNYSAYPSNPVTAVGGTGTGATFNLTLQPADLYLDTTANSLYVCTTAGTNATSVWALISGKASGVTQYIIVAEFGDYFSAHTFDGSNTGSALVKIAKSMKLRNSITNETINGIAWTYTYQSFHQRTASATISGTPVTEKQVVVPWFLTNDLLQVATTTGIVTLPSGAGVTSLIDLNVDGRAWARAFNQTTGT